METAPGHRRGFFMARPACLIPGGGLSGPRATRGYLCG